MAPSAITPDAWARFAAESPSVTRLLQAVEGAPLTWRPIYRAEIQVCRARARAWNLTGLPPDAGQLAGTDLP